MRVRERMISACSWRMRARVEMIEIPSFKAMFSPDSEAIGVLTSSIRRDVFNLFTAATQPMRWFQEESQGSTGDAETDGWGRRIFYCDTVITRRSA